MASPAGQILPAEYASKIGHIKLIQEPHIQSLIEAFETTEDTSAALVGDLSGSLDLNEAGRIEDVIAIDGSYLTIPNSLKRHRSLAFMSATAVNLKLSELRAMHANPIIDPRDLARRLEDTHGTIVAALPLSGISIPGQSVVKTIRDNVHELFTREGLYKPLNYLISRGWIENYEMTEHMACLKCGEDVRLPRNQIRFACPACNEPHTLSDYLQLVNSTPDDWARENIISDLSSVTENLLLLGFLIDRYLLPPEKRDRAFRETLFVKDGPLVLRSQLSRLVFAARAFFEHLKAEGLTFHVVGVEKTGELVSHIPMIERVLKEPGDYFLPSVQYLQERIKGVVYNPDPANYRSQYGTKVVVRLGKDHVVAFNIPTGEFPQTPTAADLVGFAESMGALSNMLSSAHENALVPLKLANSLASISHNPSKGILERFAQRLLKD